MGERKAEEHLTFALADTNAERAVEGELFQHGEDGPGLDSLSGKVAEHLGVLIGDANYLGALGWRELLHRCLLNVRHGAVERGDDVAMRIELRMA